MIPNLNKRIFINKATYASDGMGGQTFTTSARGVWASFDQVSGTEVYKFDSSETNVKFKVTIRYRADNVISNADTLSYDDRIFRIVYIDQGSFERNYITLYIIEDNAQS